MTTSKPKGFSSVMASRVEAPDSLDLFPSPPWSVRALFVHVIPWARGVAWEPATGLGHMAAALEEHFEAVYRSDVFDYGGLDAVGSYTGVGADVVATPDPRPDWIITNPPFNGAVEFAERALEDASEGVALLLRTSWIEGADRYERLFSKRPPAIVAPFVERVPMVKGRWDPDASTATSYCWFVWQSARGYRKVTAPGETRLLWIPPGCRQALTKPDDRRRFAAWSVEGEGSLELFPEAAE